MQRSLEVLQSFANHNQLVTTSYNEIAKKAGYCRTVTIHAIKELELSGKIVRYKNTIVFIHIFFFLKNFKCKTRKISKLRFIVYYFYSSRGYYDTHSTRPY